MAELGRKTKRYPSELTAEEWVRIEPLLPEPSRRGQRPAGDLREVRNAIRSMARSAGGWRMLDREAAGREASPTGGMLGDRRSAEGHSQIVKAPVAEVRGFDGGRRIVGRKRHVAVAPEATPEGWSTDGWLLMVNLRPADVSDSAGARTILAAIRKRWPWLKHLSRPT